MGMSFKRGQRVFIDTAPLIYWFEENSLYVRKMARFFDEVTNAKIALVTSMVTYIELLTFPEKKGDHDLSAKYQEYLLNSEQINVHPLNVSVANAAIRLRATAALKTPDAIQLATAKISGCDYILSNDNKWAAISDVRVVLVASLPE